MIDTSKENATYGMAQIQHSDRMTRMDFMGGGYHRVSYVPKYLRQEEVKDPFPTMAKSKRKEVLERVRRDLEKARRGEDVVTSEDDDAEGMPEQDELDNNTNKHNATATPTTSSDATVIVNETPTATDDQSTPTFSESSPPAAAAQIEEERQQSLVTKRLAAKVLCGLVRGARFRAGGQLPSFIDGSYHEGLDRVREYNCSRLAVLLHRYPLFHEHDPQQDQLSKQISMSSTVFLSPVINSKSPIPNQDESSNADVDEEADLLAIVTSYNIFNLMEDMIKGMKGPTAMTNSQFNERCKVIAAAFMANKNIRVSMSNYEMRCFEMQQRAEEEALALEARTMEADGNGSVSEHLASNPNEPSPSLQPSSSLACSEMLEYNNHLSWTRQLVDIIRLKSWELQELHVLEVCRRAIIADNGIKGLSSINAAFVVATVDTALAQAFEKCLNNSTPEEERTPNSSSLSGSATNRRRHLTSSVIISDPSFCHLLPSRLCMEDVREAAKLVIDNMCPVVAPAVRDVVAVWRTLQVGAFLAIPQVAKHTRRDQLTLFAVLYCAGHSLQLEESGVLDVPPPAHDPVLPPLELESSAQEDHDHSCESTTSHVLTFPIVYEQHWTPPVVEEAHYDPDDQSYHARMARRNLQRASQTFHDTVKLTPGTIFATHEDYVNCQDVGTTLETITSNVKLNYNGDEVKITVEECTSIKIEAKKLRTVRLVKAEVTRLFAENTIDKNFTRSLTPNTIKYVVMALQEAGFHIFQPTTGARTLCVRGLPAARNVALRTLEQLLPPPTPTHHRRTSSYESSGGGTPLRASTPRQNTNITALQGSTLDLNDSVALRGSVNKGRPSAAVRALNNSLSNMSWVSRLSSCAASWAVDGSDKQFSALCWLGRVFDFSALQKIPLVNAPWDTTEKFARGASKLGVYNLGDIDMHDDGEFVVTVVEGDEAVVNRCMFGIDTRGDDCPLFSIETGGVLGTQFVSHPAALETECTTLQRQGALPWLIISFTFTSKLQPMHSCDCRGMARHEESAGYHIVRAPALDQAFHIPLAFVPSRDHPNLHNPRELSLYPLFASTPLSASP